MRSSIGRSVCFSLTIFALITASLFPASDIVAQDSNEKATEKARGPQVISYERFLSDRAQHAEGGRLLIGELNCISCHSASAEIQSSIATKQAPKLDLGSSRWNGKYIAAMLLNPSAIKRGTTMPHLLDGKRESERTEIARDIAAFLASVKPAISNNAPSPQLIRKGRKLFSEVGCLACHPPADDEMASRVEEIVDDGLTDIDFDEITSAVTIPLGELTSKYRLNGLRDFLQNPLATRPSARMPHLNLNAEEALAIASFLLRDLEVASNVQYEYFEGSWDALPDFSKLEPKQSGESFGFDIFQTDRRDGFALRFSGFIQIPADGTFTFHLGSDDGSRLLINGKEWVANDEIHPFNFKSESGELTKGAHAIAVEYFEQGGEEKLQVDIEGPNLSRQRVDSLLSINNELPEGEENPFAEPVYTDAMVASGKKHFVTIGCVNCHTIGELKPETPFIDFKNLGTGGCLAENGNARAPDFQLTSAQRAAIQSAIKVLQNDAAALNAKDDSQVHQSMLRLNCYACHSRNDLGGPATDNQVFFTGTQPEMGDEGRLPPLLTGVGAKLRADYLKKLLTEGANDRPYMNTRMPRFESHAAELAEALVAVDKLDSKWVEESIPVRRVKTYGRDLVGEQGQSCIKCHRFGQYNASGIQSINMDTMQRRLNKEWFVEYMLDPARFRPGTRMPASWPNGKTFYPEMLDGDPRRQIQSIWEYLSDGDRAALPVGLLVAKMELVPETEPIIYRNFIDGAGPRAIGTGYPEKLNLAFDANKLRLAMVWQGSFIDASRHWNGRGQGFQPPLGHNVLRFEDAPAVAILEQADQPWPTDAEKKSGYEFRGYALDRFRRPTFRYTLSGIEFSDHFVPNPIDESESITMPMEFVRSVSVAPQNADQIPDGTLFFRVAVGSSIERSGELFEIGQDWKLKIESDDADLLRSIFVRETGGKKELLIPLNKNEAAQFVVRYRW